jgi:hypothetical protein
MADFTAAEVVRIARTQLNPVVREHPPGTNRQKYGELYGANGERWCGIFVWWVYREAGYDLRRNGFANPKGTNDLDADARRAPGWRSVRKREIQPGDLVIFDFDVTERGDPADDADHTGIASSGVVGGHVRTVEGNTTPDSGHPKANGGGVFENRRPLAEVKSAFRPPFVASRDPWEIDMFLASVPGPDPRVFLVGVEGKRDIPPERVADLKRLGIPDKGDVPSVVLSLFPTLPAPGH